MVLFLLLAPIVIAQQSVVSAETPLVAEVENAIRSSESGWRCIWGHSYRVNRRLHQLRIAGEMFRQCRPYDENICVR